MGKTLKTIVASIGISLYLPVIGCGNPGLSQASAPSISQILPQTIAVGTQSQVITVVGNHFADKAAILWNGRALPTTVVDSNTLAGAVEGSSLAVPATVQLQVQNLQNGEQSQPMPVTVAAATTTSSQLAISSTSLPGAVVNIPYASTLSVAGGASPYTWSITAGQLPTGLSLSTAGSITGTPAASGTFSFTVAVADSGNPQQTKSATSSITVTPSHLAIMPLQFSTGTIGTAYSASLSATGGTPGYAWSITSGSLPSGLSLSASTGTISGKPSAAGTSSFTVTVADSENPAQISSMPTSISIASPQLAITSSTLPSGSIGAPYSISLQATGGTPTYTWGTMSGQLPTGLSLTPSTGVISGTPTASGTFSFTVAVTDSANPTQAISTPESITVGSSQLAITSSMLISGTAGTAYSVPLQASGGTLPYTWSIKSGTLPAGLTLAATSGVVSGTPTASGASQFIAVVTDNSNPVQTQSAAINLTVSAAQQAPGPGTTWYVRPDGGTRYSSNVTAGQCDGKGDSAYPGSGVNQHCAFNDVRMLYTDGSYTTGTTFPGWGWVIAGGDTVIIRGSIGAGVSYRIGMDWGSQVSFGIAGSAPASGMPPPPSGTASQHTRILGENYGSCTSQSARTQLYGGSGAGAVMALNGSSYVDVACLDVTDHSNCGRSSDTVSCVVNGAMVADFANNGIQMNNASTNITLTDVRVHGLAGAGLYGAPGDGFVATDLAILGNANAGWNADDNSGTTGWGSMLVQNFEISWNGCVEEYPIVDPLPYFSCTDQSSGGYGDGFGTSTVTSQAPGWQVHFDNGIVTYNTQDGLDALHITGPGSTMTVTRVLAYGSEGQQIKVGGATGTIQNSVIVGSCEAMTTQAIPGTPAGFGSLLAAPCRAGNTAVVVTTTPGQVTKFQGNTVFAAGAIGLEVEYATDDQGPTNVMLYDNNVFVGFFNGSGKDATPIYSNSDLKMMTNPGGSFSNNAYLMREGYSGWACTSAETNSICSTSTLGLVDETYHPYGYGNMAPASKSSAVVGAGIAVPAITLDYTGNTRPNPPSIGAYEFPE